MLPHRVDDFDDWLRAPVTAPAGDPRFEVRQAQPDEFEEIFDLVDATFGRKRSRALYHWLYRQNPLGTARCWLIRDTATGAIIASEARWPSSRRTTLWAMPCSASTLASRA